MTYSYTPKGVCSRKMEFDIEDGVIRSVRVEGGCNGNLKGICALVEGMRAEDTAARMRGIRCGNKPTSCPDQMALGIAEALEEVGK